MTKLHGPWAWSHLLAKGWVQHLCHTPSQGPHNVIAVLSSADNGAHDWNVVIRHLDLPVCCAGGGCGIHGACRSLRQPSYELAGIRPQDPLQGRYRPCHNTKDGDKDGGDDIDV